MALVINIYFRPFIGAPFVFQVADVNVGVKAVDFLDQALDAALLQKNLAMALDRPHSLGRPT